MTDIFVMNREACAKIRQHRENRFISKMGQPWHIWQAQFYRCLGIEWNEMKSDQNQYTACDRNNLISLFFRSIGEALGAAETPQSAIKVLDQKQLA